MAETDTQESETQVAPETGPAETMGSGVDVAALQAQLDSAQKQIGKLNKENEKHRHAAKEKASLLEEQGQFKELAAVRAEEVSALTARIEELSAFADKAKRWDEFEKSEIDRINAEAEQAPEWVKSAIAATQDLAARRSILSGWQAEANTSKKPAHAGSVVDLGGPPDETTREGRRRVREAWDSKVQKPSFSTY